MIEKLRRLLVLHEGKVPHAYQDSLGFWTIGVGRLIDKRKGGKLRDDEIELMLTNDIVSHTSELLKHQPWAKNLDEVRRAVLYDMAFNLGIEPFNDNGVKDWPVFLGQVKAGQYSAAADNMLSTKWAQQVGQRAQRLAKMMRTGAWPDEIMT